MQQEGFKLDNREDFPTVWLLRYENPGASGSHYLDGYLGFRGDFENKLKVADGLIVSVSSNFILCRHR